MVARASLGGPIDRMIALGNSTGNKNLLGLPAGQNHETRPFRQSCKDRSTSDIFPWIIHAIVVQERLILF
jgi:hypothetical protein